MNQELIRINSLDGIEQVGILYTPMVETKKIVIHVHGLNGNFYENRFLDDLAKAYTRQHIAFLTFNNRGVNFITELLKGREYEIIGGCLESFKDSILDIEGVINWVKDKGYQEIILEGHSYGCNKVLYYYHMKHDKDIKNIVLLAPCDIPAEVKKNLNNEEYSKAFNDSSKLIKEEKSKELIDFKIMANGKISAGTYYYDFLPNGENDFIRYREGINSESKVLKDISIPVLVIFGDKDDCVLTEDIETIKGYLSKNISRCKIEIIKDADHSYSGKEKELGKVIIDNFKEE